MKTFDEIVKNFDKIWKKLTKLKNFMKLKN